MRSIAAGGRALEAKVGGHSLEPPPARPAFMRSEWVSAAAGRCFGAVRRTARALFVLSLGVDGVFGNFREDFVGFFFLFERLT